MFLWRLVEELVKHELVSCLRWICLVLKMRIIVVKEVKRRPRTIQGVAVRMRPVI